MVQRRQLPPLNALRAFEAAARLGGFAAAADELCVTASAVSQQVKTLEDWLGVPLFQRQPRGLVLTERGRRYRAELAEALDAMHRATQAVRRRDGRESLTVTTTHSFAAHWLAPRLHRFSELHPEIDVRVWAATQLVDLATEDADAAIRFGSAATPGLHAEFLATESVTPMCTPRLLDERPLREPADLAAHTLLHDEWGFGRLPTLSWRSWLKAAGALDRVPLGRAPAFSDNHLSLLAARAGRGVALGRTVLARQDLALGELVAPFPLALDTGLAYRLTCLPARKSEPAIRAFTEWLRAELNLST
jgi:LysR family glycine cleavage system transcriptional activator